MPKVKFLPAATKSHLHKLVTNSTYRKNASSASYNLGGPGSPGVPVKKFGWEQNLPAGTEQRKTGQKDPGKFRLASYSKPGGSVYWYMMEHVGSNSYKFEAITDFPACPLCHGSGDTICPDCKGTGRIVDGRFSSPCTKCRNTNPPGVLVCECGSKHIANGISVNADLSKW